MKRKLIQPIRAAWRWLRCLVLPWRVRYYAKDPQQFFVTGTKSGQVLCENVAGIEHQFYAHDLYKAKWQNSSGQQP